MISGFENKGEGNDNDFFGSFDTSKPAKPAGMRSTGAGRLAVPSKRSNATSKAPAPAPAVTKLAVDKDAMDDGWDDF